MPNRSPSGYETMQEIYVQGDSANLAIMIQYGVEYILVQYTGDDLTSIRIASKVSR